MSVFTPIVQPGGTISIGRSCYLRDIVEKDAGKPLLRKLSVVPDKGLNSLGEKYKYDITMIKQAIMRDQWC